MSVFSDFSSIFATFNRLIQGINDKINTYQLINTTVINNVITTVNNDYFILDPNNSNNIYTQKVVTIGDITPAPSSDFTVVGNTTISGNIITVGGGNTSNVITIGNNNSSISILGNVSISGNSFNILNDLVITANQRIHL